MNVIGEIVDVLPVQSGEGKNGAWTKSTYIVETGGQYPKKIAMCIWGDKLGTLHKGNKVDFSIDLESREFNGKWFTEAKAFKYELLSSGGSQKAKPATKEKPEKPEKPEKDGKETEQDFSSFESANSDHGNLPF